jgi:S-layer protein (TIGR01567 family)
LLTAALAVVNVPAVNGQVSEAAWIRGHFSTGNGIWGPEDFGWFYYDLDKGLGSESLSVDVEDRLAEESHVVYKSDVFSSEFEYEPWGNYESIAFLGKPYLAGYPESSFTEEISSLENGSLREVLVDLDQAGTLTYSEPLLLEDGYELAVAGISESNDEVHVVLLKNREAVDRKVVSVGDTYAFKIDDVPIILVHIADAMCGVDCGMVEVDGAFQVSDDPVIELVQGELLDKMKLAELSEEGVELRSDQELILKRDSVVPLIGSQLSLIVLDTPSLSYYPQGGIFDYGVHVIRGPVYDENSNLSVYHPLTGAVVGQVKARYDSRNFSGFFFDPEDMLGSEGLVIFNLTDRTIMPYRSKENNGIRVGTSGMQYATLSQSKDFEFQPWGEYDIISLLGQPYFAGYGKNTSDEIGHISSLLQEQVIQPLLDSDEAVILNSGRSLSLREGYDLLLLSVSNDRAFIHLRKNGEMIKSLVLTANSTYTYEADVGDVNDLPIIAIHVQNVFESDPERGMQGMVIDGLFQVSERYYIPVDPGRDFGEVTIVASNPAFIQMVNPDYVTLDRDSSQGLWYGMDIRVADNDTLRYFLYNRQYVVPSPELAGINYPKAVPSSREANFTIAIKAAEIQRVSADILDPDGRTVFGLDLTEGGIGSGDNWIFGWRWNATSLRLSDDGGPLLDANQPVPALLYLNESAEPVKVWILFDRSGRMASMQDSETETSYYLSPYGMSLVNSNLSYEDMLANETARREYIKIEPGRSTLKFFDFFNGSSRLNSTNHTITGPMESIEPHAVRVGAKQGKYELRLIIANAVNTLFISDAFYFQITEPEVRGIVLGSSNATPGETVSVRMDVPRSGGEKRINISYDPAVVEATGVTGPCNVPSYIDPERGMVRLVMPVNCSSTNLTFRALSLGDKANATTRLQVDGAVMGFKPEGITNGSIKVIAKGEGETDGGTARKSNAPAFTAALTAFVLTALAWRRRRG